MRTEEYLNIYVVVGIVELHFYQLMLDCEFHILKGILHDRLE